MELKSNMETVSWKQLTSKTITKNRVRTNLQKYIICTFIIHKYIGINSMNKKWHYKIIINMFWVSIILYIVIYRVSLILHCFAVLLFLVCILQKTQFNDGDPRTAKIWNHRMAIKLQTQSYFSWINPNFRTYNKPVS